MNRRKCCTVGACPLAYNEVSENAQQYGCLPSGFDIVVMKIKYNRTWACHSNPTQPCLGGLKILKKNNMPYKVEGELLTLESNWEDFISISEEEHNIIRRSLIRF